MSRMTMQTRSEIRGVLHPAPTSPLALAATVVSTLKMRVIVGRLRRSKPLVVATTKC